MTPEAKLDHIFTLLVQSADMLRTMNTPDLIETLHTAHLDASDALFELRRQMDETLERVQHITTTLDSAYTEYEIAQSFGWTDRINQAWQTAMSVL